jgi:ferredoxin
MRVTAQAERCVGSGMCALTASEIFGQDQNDGTVIVLQPEPAVALHEAARVAAYQCPSGAIQLTDVSDQPA